VLVVHKDSAQEVKKVVDHLKRSARSEHEVHSRVYRPWGWYEGIDAGERFQVKRIMVKPEKSYRYRCITTGLSIGGGQRNCKRYVRRRSQLITENESTYIRSG